MRSRRCVARRRIAQPAERAGRSGRSASSCRSRAGSSSDTVARLVGQKLGERLGQQLVVENRVGGGGMIGTEQVARAEPDGYTLGPRQHQHARGGGERRHRSPYDPVKDFAPVAMLGSSPFLLALYPGVPAKTVPELIALAKAKPRALNYASAGPATLAHLSGALFEKMAKIELTHVPYRGTAQSTVDLLEGRVEMQFGTIPPTLAHVRAGKLRALAVTGAVRNPTLPDVPTIAESGPARLRMLRSGRRSSRRPRRRPPSSRGSTARPSPCSTIRTCAPRFAKHGVEPEPGSPEALGARIRDDVKKWRDVVTGAGIRSAQSRSRVGTGSAAGPQPAQSPPLAHPRRGSRAPAPTSMDLARPSGKLARAIRLGA